MNVGERISQLRATYGVSQYALWKRSGIAQGALSQYESGRKTPGIDTLERICAGLGISLAEFFAIDEETDRSPIQLSGEEKELVACYRALDKDRQKDVRLILHTLAQIERKTNASEAPSPDSC